MATNPAARQLMKGKRPIWMTVLLVVGAILIWYAQQKGWIKKNAIAPNAGPVATIPEPSRQAPKAVLFTRRNWSQRTPSARHRVLA